MLTQPQANTKTDRYDYCFRSHLIIIVLVHLVYADCISASVVIAYALCGCRRVGRCECRVCYFGRFERVANAYTETMPNICSYAMCVLCETVSEGRDLLSYF